MDSPILLRCILIGLYALASASAFIAIPPTQLQISISSLPGIRTNNNTNSFRSLKSFLSESESDMHDTGPKNDSTSKNEFSRTIRVTKWFGGGGGGGSQTNRNRKRTMDLSISATSEERQALATRFRLTDITDLSAELVVRPALSGSGGQVDDGDSECIEATGTVCAQVTQTCVRTNEEFDVTLEFSFETVLRALSPNSDGVITNDANENDAEPLSAGELAALDAAAKLGNNGGGGRPRKKKGGKRNTKGVRGGQDLDGIGMKQLKDILVEYEVTDEIIEDEACFCTDGIVDCGEIVAQMFRSKLDPYPKKPGSVSFLPALLCLRPC